MKGPYERLKYDLRRLWECPKCHRRERTDGAKTSCLCDCESQRGGPPIPMKLLEEAGHRTVPAIVPRISDEPPVPTDATTPAEEVSPAGSAPDTSADGSGPLPQA